MGCTITELLVNRLLRALGSNLHVEKLRNATCLNCMEAMPEFDCRTGLLKSALGAYSVFVFALQVSWNVSFGSEVWN